VEDLLLLARLDAGRPLRRQPVDLTQLAVDSVSDAHVAGPGHKWRISVPDIPVIVPGDEPRLRQVLANLLANARTHTPAGTTVVVAIGDAGDGEVRCRSPTNGPGIPPGLLPEVFERFAAATARGPGGRQYGPGTVDRGRRGVGSPRQRRGDQPPGPHRVRRTAAQPALTLSPA